MKRAVNHFGLFVAAFFAVSPQTLWSDTSWINPSSGLWREPANWSFGVPDVGQPTTHISFGGETKTITVDAATPATNLVIQRLRMEPSGVTNTLLLTGVVFEVRSTIEMRRDGAVMHIAKSTLRLPSAGSSLDLNAGEVRLESGAIVATNVSTRIGRDGGKAAMRIEAGTAQFNELLIGRRVSSSGAQGSLFLSGGRLEISGNLDVGADTNCTGEIIVTGGEMVATATNFSTAIGEQGTGSLVISNGVVRFDDVHVGRHTNVIGTLHIAGGSNSIDTLALGRFPLSTGMVFQTGGQFECDTIRVGEEGHGEMTIAGGTAAAGVILVAGATNTASGILIVSGGTTTVGSNVMVGTTTSTGQVVLTGGNLVVTNEASLATLEAVQGVANLSGGSLVLDRLRITNATGRAVFKGGLLSSRDTVVSNGLPFVVGDGTNAATFHMNGGTHYFANGLTISPNATLTGCGTIIGTVNNQGTIATNCGPAAPVLLSPAYAAGEFSFSLQSRVGESYTIERASTVDAAVWDVVTVTNGTGNLIIIRDRAAGGLSRFYRARAQ
jgi:hypothetical protein